MSTVCSSTLLGGLVDLDVLDDQVAGVQTLGISVGLSVLEQAEEELGGLGGPSCAGDTELLSCTINPSALCLQTLAHPLYPRLALLLWGFLTLCSTSSSASVSPHGDGLLVVDDIGEEGLRALELPAVDGLGGLSCVLEAHTEVGAARAGALRWVDLRRCVSNLHITISLRCSIDGFW